MQTYKGGCHCGRVSFEVDAPAKPVLSECNCSICRMAGYLHLIVPKFAFRLLQGEESSPNRDSDELNHRMAGVRKRHDI